MDVVFQVIAGFAAFALASEVAARRDLSVRQQLGLLALGVLVIQALLPVITGG